MLERLDALRRILDGEAGKAMGKFIKALAPQRKKWRTRAPRATSQQSRDRNTVARGALARIFQHVLPPTPVS